MISRRHALGLLGAAGLVPAIGHTQPKPAPFVTEDVAFDAADGVTLRGALYLPTNAAPRAGIVIVHGAARYEDWAQTYSSAGLATLVYDKRGCGESGGVYVGRNNTGADNLGLLTADAVSAAMWLTAHPLLAGRPHGFAGPSQAGWIIPPAALETGAAFIALTSGPVCKVSEAVEFEAQGRADLLEYAGYLRTQSETDPIPVLRELTIPGFWIYGGQDRNVPVQLCVRNLDALTAEGHSYEYSVDSETGHFHGAPAHRRIIAWLEGLRL